MPRFRDRRHKGGDRIARALLDEPGEQTFDDLAAHGDLVEVAAWLGHAVEEGIVEDVHDGGPRRFRLRPRGGQVLRAQRRREDA
jgi:hypothetical protein